MTYNADTELKVRSDNGVLRVTLDSPPVNAAGQAMNMELATIFRGADRDPALKVVLLTGVGKTFSAGGDIAAMLRDSTITSNGAPGLSDRAGSSPTSLTAESRSSPGSTVMRSASA